MIEEKNTKGYIYGLGRRKQSIAKVKVFFGGSGKITINGKSLDEYIKVYEKIEMVKIPLKETGMTDTFDIVATVCGGGIAGQAGAISLGIARALIKFDENLRPVLKKLGLLERDARVKERKKFGLKKARRAPQWSKR